MATRSAIGYKLPTGEVRGIYCHWDGYVEHNGAMLQTHYTDAAKIAAMVELGDMSTLAAEIADCVYYGRDRGETDVAAQTYNDVDEFVTHYADGCDYEYLWNGNEWIITNGNLVFDRVEDLLQLEAA
tara:strand:- start:340 stop:720 length:381 start_codon:yes stop_codon:yes gene_type:complete